jgi:small-conductance mechanosensitive channel
MSEFEFLLNDLNYYYLISEPAISQYLVLLASIALFFFARKKIHDVILSSSNKSFKSAVHGIERVLNPLIILIFISTASLITSFIYKTNLLDFIEIILIALIASRLGVYSLRYIFAGNPLLRAFENIIALFVWVYTLIYIFGFSSLISNSLETVAFKVGGTQYNLLIIIQLIFGIIFAIAIAMSFVSFIERKLMGVKSLDRNLRAMINKIIKLTIYIFAVVIALDTIGIDLTFLSVFGGAFGVGLGFGMQKITSNYISGFTILMDKSLHIGDLITVGDNYGVVTSIKSRYTVLRKLDGVEVIIPNENLISENIVNHTYTDRKVRVAIDVQVGYSSSIDLASEIMLKATKDQERVLEDPEPVVYLQNFGESGIDLTLVFYVEDAEEGTLRLKSDISKEFWREFQKQGVEIPFPQRDLHIKSGELKS